MRFWGLAVPAAAYLYWQNNGLCVSEYTICLSGLPRQFEGYRIAHLSDLHGKRFGVEQRRLIKLLWKLAPDLIAITGDLVDKRRSVYTGIESAVELAYGVAQIAPAYYVTGNHEWQSGLREELGERIRETGTVLLDNRAQIIRRGEEKILLAGLADEVSLQSDPTGWKKRSMLDAVPGRVRGGAQMRRRLVLRERLLRLRTGRTQLCVLALAHRPNLFSLLASAGADLVLSGHAHGGQMRLPILGGVIAPDQGFFPRYTEGIYQYENAKMVVSRGLGNSAFPQRIHNRPEVVVVTLRTKSE